MDETEKKRGTLRTIARIKAMKFPGHIRPRMLFRLPSTIFRDYIARRKMAKELFRASNKEHDRFVARSNFSENGTYANHMTDYVLSQMPAEVCECWEEDGFSVQLTSDRYMESSFSSVARRSGRSVSRGQAKNTNGLFVPFDDVIYVKEGTYPFPRIFAEYCWQNTEDVCGHEIGHYVDCIFDEPSVDDELFLEAYRVERCRLDAYSASDNREYFATTCWICRKYPKIARKYIPQTYHYFRVLFGLA